MKDIKVNSANSAIKTKAESLADKMNALTEKFF